MILTEDEAKKHWCPFAREETRQRKDGYRCAASECMAWRWLMTNQSLLGAAWNLDGSMNWYGNTPRGYCGLAGRADGKP